MIRRLLPVALLLCATGAAGQPESSPESDARSALPQSSAADRALSALLDSGFRGAVAVETGNGPIEFGSLSSGPDTAPGAHRPWPWASVTKQVLAVLVMQQVEAGTIDLETPADTYLPDLGSNVPSPTVRQLLQHRSGLPNPDDSPEDATGFPSFYSDGPTGLDWCIADRTAPTEEWRYNNCDYIVLGAILERVTGTPIEALVEEKIGTPSGWSDTALLRVGSARDFQGRDAIYMNRIARYGSSAGLVGPLEDMVRFDRALMSGKLLSPQARASLWDGDPALGYMALGQWAFEAPLKGCDAPVKIVERRGNIGKYQVRNIILPDRDLAIALATADEGFDFGEIWSGSGAMHDTLSAVACQQ